MNLDDLQHFADDLRNQLGLDIVLVPDSNPAGLHLLQVNGVDFYFHADGHGYDGWGRPLHPSNP